MKIKSEDIKKLRQTTGAGIMDCKKALEEFDGDFDEAVKSLRKKGAKVAAKKSERSASEGTVGEYLHFNKKLGVLVEVNCETDFVAKNEKFTAFAHELAMHIAANNPRWIKSDEVPEDVIEGEKEIYRAQLKKENKPDNIIEKILDGKLKKFYEDNCLLSQVYSGDDKITVEQAIKDMVHAIGENIQVGRFTRFAIGESSE